jgi:DNA uptake protein ComE-like DNA-binding protein
MKFNCRKSVPSGLIAVLLLVCNDHATAANEHKAVLDKTNSLVTAKSGTVSQSPGTGPSSSKTKLVDINKASKAELMTLAGIGEVEASKIIAGRPYNSKADVTTHGQLPAGVYQTIKAQIVVR